MRSTTLSALRFTRPALFKLLVVAGLLTIPSVTSQAVEGAGRGPAIHPNLANPPAPRGELVEGEILVAFKPGAAAADVEAARQGVNARIVKTFAAIGAQHWRLPDGLDVARAVQALSANPNVRYAEPNFGCHAADSPNDPRRGDLWGMHNVGQTGGTIDADIDAMEAWQIAQGSTEVVVAIIDTGIDYNHPDLAANIWRNPGETGLDANGNDKATNGIDDDGNGYVDDVIGWDFVNHDNDPFDDFLHGTHVAGTIGALGNNGIGVIGVCPVVRLMPLKFLDSDGFGSTADAVSAVLYAASFVDANGNKIVRLSNNSWGGGGFSQALQDAIQSCGALFVAAAGNSSTNSISYPAGYNLPNIVSVAATDHKDLFASFSNYGSWVQLAAPGVDVVSTLPGNTYGPLSGTSMATPHTCGALALLRSQHLDWDNAMLKARILATVDVKASLAGKVSSGGRLNIGSALSAPALPTDSIAPNAVADFQVAGIPTRTSIALSWSASGDDSASGLGYAYDVRYLPYVSITDQNWANAIPLFGEPSPQAAGAAESFAATGLAPGTDYYFAAKVVDEQGNSSPLSAVVYARTHPIEWRVQAVDNVGSVGFYSSLAYNASGQPTIAYSDQTNQRIKFATRAGNTWNLEAVGAGVGGVSLAYDASGNPSISWTASKLLFGTKVSGTWNIATIEKSAVQNDVTSLAYSPNGTPSISYRNTSSSGGLKFAWRSGSTWKTQLVHAGAGARYNSLAYNNNGNPAIAYSQDVNGDNSLDTLSFASGLWNGNGYTWTTENVETGVVGYGVFASLRFDANGNPAIIHGNQGEVRLLRKIGGTWHGEVVDSGDTPFMTYDSANQRFYFAYDVFADDGSDVLKVATGAAAPWSFEPADTLFFLSWPGSLKVNGAGIPTMTYNNGGLQFAQKDPNYAGPSVLLFDDLEVASLQWLTEGNDHDSTRKSLPPTPGQNNLWHKTTRRANDPGHSPFNSWYYGIDAQGNYDTGTRNWGRLISPSISVPPGARLELQLNQLVNVEGGNYETPTIQVSVVGGAWQNVFQRTGRSTSFVTDRVDLSKFLGQTIRLGFFIDTKDGLSNTFEGWDLDDVLLTFWP